MEEKQVLQVQYTITEIYRCPNCQEIFETDEDLEKHEEKHKRRYKFYYKLRDTANKSKKMKVDRVEETPDPVEIPNIKSDIEIKEEQVIEFVEEVQETDISYVNIKNEVEIMPEEIMEEAKPIE
jgi:hypothetical protein